jgi:metallo-beta-lactamase family protein
MKLTLFGAAKEVTGSCTLVETGNTRILIDCGMFQGSREAANKNLEPFPFKPSSIDAVVFTHAHIDHIGRYPKLVKQGFSGRAFATHPTRLLTQLMWRDTAHVMKDHEKRDKRPAMYYPQDVAPAFNSVHGFDYGTKIQVAEGVHVTFRDAGHIFGSAFVELEAEGKTVVFSGDLGNRDVPILRDTSPLGHADAVMIESTYGDRLHESKAERSELLKQAIIEAVARKGVLMIPAFSLERTQEILYELNELAENQEIPKVPIFLDSPLAIRILPIYERFKEYYDLEAIALSETDDFFEFPGLKITRKPNESRAIDRVPPPKVIIAASGMMHGGRIMHHLAEYLDDANNTVLVVGFQAGGTVGRSIRDGAETVKIDHEMIPVRAQVKIIGAYSAHADQAKLLEWLGSGPEPPPTVILDHGEPGAMAKLAQLVEGQYGSKTVIPEPGEPIEI